MKYFVLDTNILIKDPDIILRWSPNYKIIIPRLIFSELDRVTSRLGGPIGRFWQNMEKAEKTGFISVLDSDYPISEDLINKSANSRLSIVDLQLAEICLKLQKEKKDVTLVTNDRPLRVYAENLQLKTIDLFQFQNFISAFKATDLGSLKTNETIKQYQYKRFIYGLISGILLSSLTSLFINNFQKLYETFNIWGTIIIILFSGLVFFLFRTNFRWIYGLIEFGFGFFISIRVFSVFDFKYDSIGIVEIIQLVGGIYVMVRGLSNVDDGVKGTLAEPSWLKITRWKKIASA